MSADRESAAHQQALVMIRELKLDVNWRALSKPEQKALTKLGKERMAAPSLELLMSEDLTEYAQLKSVGRANTGRLRKLRQRMTKHLSELSQNADVDYPLGVLRWGRGPVPSIEKLESYVIEDFEVFLSELPPPDCDLLTQRFGYHTPRRTLDDLGKERRLTRERIRQKARDIIALLPRVMRLSSPLLWRSLRRGLHHDLVTAMPNLAAAFADQREMYELLEIIGGQRTRTIYKAQVLPSKVALNMLDDYFADNAGPYDRSTLLEELESQGEFRRTQAERYLQHLLDHKHLRLRDGYYEPIGLPRRHAVAHLLVGVDYPMPFRDIIRSVNARQLASTPIPEGRMGHSISGNPWVYWAQTGSYAHRRHLGVDHEAIEEICQSVAAVLEKIESKTANLRSVHNDLGSRIPYEVMRWAIGEHGETYGVHFRGHSRADSVGLTPVSKSVTIRDAIAELLERNPGGMTAQQLAKRLKATPAAMSLCLDDLQKDGRVARVNVKTYMHTSHAFLEADVDDIAMWVDEILSDEIPIVEADYIREVVNESEGFAFSKEFYVAFVRWQGTRRGWHFYYTLVSKQPFDSKSLRAMAREAAKERGCVDGAMELLRERVQLTDRMARRVRGWIGPYIAGLGVDADADA